MAAPTAESTYVANGKLIQTADDKTSHWNMKPNEIILPDIKLKLFQETIMLSC